MCPDRATVGISEKEREWDARFLVCSNIRNNNLPLPYSLWRIKCTNNQWILPALTNGSEAWHLTNDLKGKKANKSIIKEWREKGLYSSVVLFFLCLVQVVLKCVRIWKKSTYEIVGYKNMLVSLTRAFNVNTSKFTAHYCNNFCLLSYLLDITYYVWGSNFR